MVGQTALVFQNLYFKINKQYNCNYLMGHPIANIIIELIIQILGNYLPKLYTIYIFRLK